MEARIEGFSFSISVHNMETLTTKPRAPVAPSDPPAARPSWVMLQPNVDKKLDSDSSVADAKTRAASRTSSGQSFSVSFDLVPPPATSRFYCDWIGGAPGDGENSDDYYQSQIYRYNRDGTKNLSIIAAHDNSVLIAMSVPTGHDPCFNKSCEDYFLYETGGAASRLPSLSLLPGCYFSTQYDREDGARHVPTRSKSPRSLSRSNTGMLRRGEGEHLVAQFEVINAGNPPHGTAELCVLRPGGEWDLKQLPIVHHDGGELPYWPKFDSAVPVGVRFMCWVDYVNGFYLCDMATCPNNVLYVPLPVPPPERRRRNSDRPHLQYCRNLAAAGPEAVRFVSVAPRCCCGGHGKTSCERSRFAFNVTTWTLTLRTEEPMAWVKDGVLDCDELWQLPNYERLPRVAPQYPIVSSDNPDVVCFVVCEDHYVIDNADKTVWLLLIDTRCKTLSTVLQDASVSSYWSDDRVPANLRW